jgi:hypothetical protein
MERLKGVLLFWYDFVIGDDWLMAAGVVVALVVTWAAAQVGVTTWLWLPLLVIVVLATSLWRAAARSVG